MDLSTLAAFAAAFFLFAASPGPDNMTIVARTVSHGAPLGIAYGLGTTVGVLVCLMMGDFGLSLLPNVVGASLTAGHFGRLAAMVLVVESVVIGGHVLLATRARRLLRTPRIVRRVNRVAGGAMIGVGVAIVAAG